MMTRGSDRRGGFALPRTYSAGRPQPFRRDPEPIPSQSLVAIRRDPNPAQRGVRAPVGKTRGSRAGSPSARGSAATRGPRRSAGSRSTACGSGAGDRCARAARRRISLDGACVPSVGPGLICRDAARPGSQCHLTSGRRLAPGPRAIGRTRDPRHTGDDRDAGAIVGRVGCGCRSARETDTAGKAAAGTGAIGSGCRCAAEDRSGG